MKRQACLFCALGFVLSTHAQQQNRYWIFPSSSGLDHGTAPPTLFTSHAVTNPRPAAALADLSGQLRIYSDGETMWNGQHQVIPSINPIIGPPPTRHSYFAVPRPGYPNIYYVFAVHPFVSPLFQSPAYAHEVDLDLNAGNGEVIQPNIMLMDSACQPVTGVVNGAGSGVWVLLQHLTRPEMHAFRIDANGLDPTPVVSYTGIPQPSIPNVQAQVGCMRPTTLGDRLFWLKAYLHHATDCYLEFFDLDRNTGMVSNWTRFDGPAGFRYVEISPNDKYLYAVERICQAGIASRLWQYDISSSDPALILASKTLIHEAPITYGTGCNGAHFEMAVDPNGSIHVGMLNEGALSVIHQPNLPGALCQFQYMGVPLAGGFMVGYTANQLRTYPEGSVPIADRLSDAPPISIHPNPAHGSFTVSMGSAEAHQVVLFDALGRMVHRALWPQQASRTLLNTEGLSQGLYIVQVVDGRGQAIGKQRLLLE